MFGVHAGQRDWQFAVTAQSRALDPADDAVLCRAGLPPLLGKDGRRSQGFLPPCRTMCKISGEMFETERILFACNVLFMSSLLRFRKLLFFQSIRK